MIYDKITDVKIIKKEAVWMADEKYKIIWDEVPIRREIGEENNRDILYNSNFDPEA